MNQSCTVCGEEQLDYPWERAYKDRPGPRMLRIGQVRHAYSFMELRRMVLRDDDVSGGSAVSLITGEATALPVIRGRWRCPACLCIVPDEYVDATDDNEGRSHHIQMASGYECLNCGVDLSSDANKKGVD